MKKTNWIAVFINVRWKPKGTMTIKEISHNSFSSKDEALAYAYNFHDCGYVKTIKNKTETAFIAWCGNPRYGYAEYRHTVIVPTTTNSFVVSNRDQSLRNRLQEMFDDWFKNDTRDNKMYIDESIKLSRLSWQTSIPKGWKLLRVGSTIKETDKEFVDSSYGPNFWGMVSWYNVGKKVEKTQGISWVKMVKGKEVVYKTEPGHPTPLIIRKA